MNRVFIINENTNVSCNGTEQTAHTFYPEITNHVLCKTTGKIMTYRGLLKTKYKDVWTKLCGNEFGRLMSGVGNRMKTGTNTMFPVHKKMIPRYRKVAYMKGVVDLRPQKQEVERTRLVLGGDKVDYPFNVSTNTTDLDTTKIHFNFVISTRGARFMGLNLKDFYLGTIMKRY